MYGSKRLVSAVLAGAVLAAVLGCPSSGRSHGDIPAPSAPRFKVVHRESLGAADRADIWELARGLHLGYPCRTIQFDLLEPAGTTPVGTWNGMGLVVANPGPLLERPGRFERFAETHGVDRLYSLVSADQWASPAGQSLARDGFARVGWWYSYDRYLVEKLVPVLTVARRAALPASELEARRDDSPARDEMTRHPYADLPPAAREEVDRRLDEMKGCFAFFIEGSGPGSPAQGGIIGKLMPNASYGMGMFIEKFWTSPGIRGQGYGRILMDNAVALARAKGVVVISLGTDQGLSYPFYEKYGFKRSLTLPGIVNCEGGAGYDAYEYILERADFPRNLKLSP